MKRKQLRTAICLMLMLALVFALALTANAQKASAAYDPADPQVNTAPTLTIAYKNLSYSSDIYVLYAVNYQNVTGADIQMLFWNAPQDEYLKGTETYAVTDSRVEAINGVNHRVFYSRGVAPKELTENQYCCAYIRIGEEDYYSEVVKFSPLAYVKTVAGLATMSEADRDLANALRAYANAAQIRFQYRTDDLASDTHYDITLQDAVLEDGFSYGIYKEGTQLTLTAVVPAGDSVARWIDGNRTVTGSEGQTSITYTLSADSAVRALMASDPASCEHEYSAWIAAADATCTEAGAVGHYHCDLCGRNFDANYDVIDGAVVLPALGHNWVDVAAVPATCVDGHTAYRYCSRCGEEEGNTVLQATDPHDYVENVVAPAGEARGYIDHVCSVCGDSYKTDYDYSLYSGVNFVDEGKFPIPYNFENSVYTIEVSLQLPTTQSARAGVLLGNYDGSTRGFNFEIYSNGRPRLYFVANAAGTNTKTNYDYVFHTDIRGADVKNIAVVIVPGEAKLYVDGVLTETVTLANFDMPSVGRTLVLGGDNRTGNSQSFKGTIYSATVYRDVRTDEEIVSDLVLADATDQNCCVSYNLLDSTGLTGAVTLDNILDNAQVTTAEELAYHASHGTRNIEVMNDITVDRTIYVISDVTVFSNGDYTLRRDPDFYSDIFVVGENAAGRNLILDGITCVLNLGKSGATGTLTVDGNKTNVTGDVYGTLVYINNSGVLNLRDGAVLTNNKKVGNARSLGMEQYYANMVGGAAILNINGTVNMDGGVISYNDTNFNDPNSDSSSDEHLMSCYGGAVFNNSNFVMSGGTFLGNTGYYGGAISNFQETNITGGVFDGNYTSHAGGAIYNYNSDYRVVMIGDPDGANSDPTAVIFRNNYNTVSSGGAIYSGYNCYLLVYGGVTFTGNHVPGSGGAIFLGGLGSISNAVFSENTAGTMGGAVNVTRSATNLRSTSLTGCTFNANSARNGGAVALTGSDTTITNCTATGNTASVSGGAYYIYRLDDLSGSEVVMTGGTVSGNSSDGEGGALLGDLNCEIDITGTQFTGNSSVGHGGAISLHGVESLALTNVTFSQNSTGTTQPAEEGGEVTKGNGGALYASYRTYTDNTDPENPASVRKESSVTATGCTFTENHADGWGGAVMGVAYDETATVLTLGSCTLSANTAGTHGGALSLNNSSATLTGSTVTGNTSTSRGGAFYLNAGSSLTASGTTLTGNTSGSMGGAIASFSSTAVLTNTTATGNTSGNAGGFAYVNGGTLTMNVSENQRNAIGSLSDSTLGNVSNAGGGGAIYAENGAAVSVSNADVGYNTTPASAGAIYFKGASGTITNCTVSHNASGTPGVNSYGGAMLIGYGSDVTITGSTFADNSSTTWGGAIYLRRLDADGEDPMVPSTLTMTNTSVTGNSSGIAGAVFVNANCTLTANNCSFGTNSAASGNAGAIMVGSNATLNTTASTSFSGNTATGSGGAIYADTSAAVNLAGTTLRQNTAGAQGGAIFLYNNSHLTVTGDSLFDENSSAGIGGAIYSNRAITSLTDTDFTDNTMTSSSGWYGGAIYTNGTSELSVTRCEFTGNSNPIGAGGAITARGTGTLSVVDSSFTDNSATGAGGAIQIFELSSATVTNTSFSGNTAGTTGGAIQVGKGDVAANVTLTVTGGSFTNNTATTTGGAIDVLNGTANESTGLSTLNLSGGLDGMTLSGNTAAGGGAIYVDAGAAANLDDVTLSQNSAGGTGGGAVYAATTSTVTIEDSTLTGNTTTGSGGAMYVKEGAQVTVTDTEFASCSSSNGGAMIIYGGSVTFDGGSVHDNTASGLGGAIYLRKGGSNELGSVTATGTAFSANATTGSNGGAIYVNDGTTISLTNASFTENTAYTSGGALYLAGTSPLTASNTSFTENSAKSGGAIYRAGSGAVTLTGGSFTQNETTSSHGGALYLTGTGSLSANGTSFLSNTSANHGGAIYSYLDGSSVNVSLTGCTLQGNTAAGNGGAVYHSAATRMAWTNATVKDNAATGNGDAVYVTNGSGKTTTFEIHSASFDQPSKACIFIGNSGTSVTVHKNYVTDVNHSPVDFTRIITGSSNYATTKVTYVED